MKRGLCISIVIVLIALNLYAGDLNVTGKLGVGRDPDPNTKINLNYGEIGIGQQNDFTPYLRIGMDSSWDQYIANNAYWTGSGYNYVSTGGYGGLASRIHQVSGTIQFDTASGGANPISWANRLYIANNGNVGIGTTPDSPLTINSGSYLVRIGTTATSWAGNSTYPTIFSSTSDQWVMFTNPHISYTQNGINGFSGSMTGATLRMAGDPTAASYWDAGPGTSGAGADKFSIGRNSSSYFIVDNSGNVGIGTTSPGAQYKIEVSGGDITNYPSYTHPNCALSWTCISTHVFTSHHYYGINETAPIYLGESNPIIIRGNVGIGTNVPGTNKLQIGSGSDVLGNNALSVVGGDVTIDGAGTARDPSMYFRYTSSTANIKSDGHLSFLTGASPSEKMRVSTSGDVGIGTTSPNTYLQVGDADGKPVTALTGYIYYPNIYNKNTKIYENGSGNNFPAAVMGESSTGRGIVGVTQSGAGVYGTAVNGTGKGVYGMGGTYSVVGYNENVNGYAIYCDSVTNVNGCGGNRYWYYSSDERKKENITTVNEALLKIMQLRGVGFNWKNDPDKKHQIGLIAQEVMTIVPEAVGQDPEGNYTMADGPLVALLTSAIKEQQKQIEELKKRITDIERTK